MSRFKPIVPIFGCGMLGIIQAMILFEMNTRGILIDEFITGSITITDLMVGVVIIWLLIGVIIGARS